MKRFRLGFAVLAVLGLAVVWWLRQGRSGLGAPEWPEFRGPTQGGSSTAAHLPVEWSRERNVVWKADLPGRAWSSPIVAGDRVYLTNADAEKNDDDLHEDVSLRLMALDAPTGRVLWDRGIFEIKEPHRFGVHDKNSHASPTPVYDHGRIYAHFGHFGTACLDEKGNILWTKTEPSYKTELGNGGCPVVVDDLLVFNCDGVEKPFVVALDKITGKIRWRTMRGRKAKNLYALSTPTVITVDGKKQIVTAGTRIIQALDPADGKNLWHVMHADYCVVPRPVFGDGLLFATTGFEHASLLAIRPDGKGNVTDTHVVWTATKNVPLTPSMVLAGGDLYMVSDSGIVTCLDAKTGKVWWEERVGKTTSASLLQGDGKIYLQDEFGKGYVMRAGHRFELLATNDLGDRSLASYAVHRGHLLIRTQHALWCIGSPR